MSKRPITAPRVSRGEAGRAPVAGEGLPALARFERSNARTSALWEAVQRIEQHANPDPRRFGNFRWHYPEHSKAWNRAMDAYVSASRRSRRLYRAYIAAYLASLPTSDKEAV